MDQGQHAVPPERSRARGILEFLLLIVGVVAVVWLLHAFVFQPYRIPSGSMETTIMTDDMVLAEKVSYYLRDPQPGDIVVFDDMNVEGRHLIKRCIAIGGQTVELIDGKVVVDGVALNEPYTNNLPSYPLNSKTVTYPYTVPEGYIWVMGDNRTNSQDSRYFGAISLDSVIGRGAFVYWPIENAGVLK
ncbi:MAG: signal peptidase I [Eggerthellaceae bacterium]|nr:signal peptidase I [Eggerthellaceae bacterium]